LNVEFSPDLEPIESGILNKSIMNFSVPKNVLPELNHIWPALRKPTT